MKAYGRSRWLLRIAAPLTALLVGGCVTYDPARLAAMSTVDICEAQDVQGRNITPDTRRAMDEELRRRKDDCRNHVAEVAQRRADVLHDLMYGSPDDP